jgi:ABC-type lipoprotein release transport system permease subunit
VRLALGARGADVERMIVKQGARMIAAGLVVGTAGAIALSRVLAARIPEVGDVDPVVLACAAIVLAGTAFAASWLPARRAGHVDPMEALRQN